MVGNAQVEVGFDVIDVGEHQFGGLFAIAGFKGIDDIAVIVVATARCAGAAIEGDDQR